MLRLAPVVLSSAATADGLLLPTLLPSLAHGSSSALTLVLFIK